MRQLSTLLNYYLSDFFSAQAIHVGMYNVNNNFASSQFTILNDSKLPNLYMPV